jgi:hypothetical protein
MFQYPPTDDCIELIVGERKPREVRHGVADAVAGQSFAGSIQHAWGEIKARKDRVGIGVPEQKARVPSIATASVQDALAASDIECRGPEHSARQCLVARHHPRESSQSAGQTVIVILNETTIV